MKLLISFLMVLVVTASAETVDTDVFNSVDRETAGLMDSWLMLQQGSSGDFHAGTSLIRAERALARAMVADAVLLPTDVRISWNNYLKASADCIFTFREAIGREDPSLMENRILSSFTRWNLAGEEFLNSVQSTR